MSNSVASSTPLDKTSDQTLTFLVTTDRERAKQFYMETLGLGFCSEDDFALVLHCGQTLLRITEMKDFTPQPFTVLGWQVSDIEQSARALIAAGIEPNRYPGFDCDELGLWQPPGSNARICWFNDPDGNVLSFTQS